MITDEQAKALTAGADAAKSGIEAARAAGGWLAETLGDLPKNFMGIYGDRWAFRREMQELRFQRLRAEAQAFLKDIPPERLSPPSPSVYVPLLDAAIDEEREELRRIWATLLANASVDGGKKVRRDFFKTVAEFEPDDALVLSLIDQTAGAANDRTPLMHRWLAKVGAGADKDIFELAVSKLINLRCVGEGVYRNLTFYGQALRRACFVPPAP